jgi:hypothetical protein
VEKSVCYMIIRSQTAGNADMTVVPNNEIRALFITNMRIILDISCRLSSVIGEKLKGSLMSPNDILIFYLLL